VEIDEVMEGILALDWPVAKKGFEKSIVLPSFDQSIRAYPIGDGAKIS